MATELMNREEKAAAFVKEWRAEENFIWDTEPEDSENWRTEAERGRS